MQQFFSAIFGDPNKKVLDGLQKEVSQINTLESRFQAMSDEDLSQLTVQFRERLAKGETVDQLAYEAFAAVREAARRVLGQRPYDVQLIGGLVLHKGGIAEMRTGEGKTLTAVAPLYLNALSGKGAHLVTVNDYLAKLHAAWMGQVFSALGMTTGCVQHESGYVYDANYKLEKKMEAESGEAGPGSAGDAERDATASFRVHTDYLRPVHRKEAYAADITYGTNNEFGFDYLRDNMAPTIDQCVMRAKLGYVIVDEVDSILIDEARTPLIISAPAEKSNELYYKFAQIVAPLVEKEDYNLDEKMRAATFTDAGIVKVEKAFGVENLYETAVGNVQHYAESALRAKALYKRDVNYVVKDGQVVIVDEFTGRLMPGRRFGEGQHQAIEAKEGLEIQRESVTLATVTFQNFFRMYEKLAGMTGTAATEAEEFGKIYKLEVTSIPTNIPPQRTDLPDRVFKNELGKFMAVVKEIKERHATGQPLLVGTVSIEKNEILGKLLEREGVPFELLNAKNHEREAEIIAQAGRFGAVTIATNMAGRGVDILLGGNPVNKEEADKVRAVGGLHVIGTERHESRRIDNQLRGRAGRQGDPGSTQFFLSLEDDLMRIFGSDRIKTMMNALGIPDDMPIENKMVTKSLESAQGRVESHHFDTRKHLLEYDDVLNKHREVIYRRRREVLETFAKEEPTALREAILDIVEGEVEQVVLFHTGETEKSGGAGSGSAGDLREIGEVLTTMIPFEETELTLLREDAKHATKGKLDMAELRTKLIERAMNMARKAYDATETRFPDRAPLRQLERAILLRAIDALWIEHLEAIGSLRHGIGLQGYAQRDPLVEYKRRSYEMFQRLLSAINEEIAYNVFKQFSHAIAQRDRQAAGGASAPAAQPASTMPAGVNPPVATAPGNEVDFSKAGRNDECPCGSGKKFKKCHGA